MASLVFRFYQIQFRPGLRLGTFQGVHDASPNPLVGWGGDIPSPFPFPTPLDTFGVSPTVPHHFSKPSAAPGANCFISAEFSITL